MLRPRLFAGPPEQLGASPCTAVTTPALRKGLLVRTLHLSPRTGQQGQEGLRLAGWQSVASLGWHEVEYWGHRGAGCTRGFQQGRGQGPRA